MKFIVNYSLTPATRDEAIARFKATGGLPPKNVTLIGRWTQSDFSGGFALVETADAKALTEFALMWTDLIDIKVVPVIDDPELNDVLSRPRS